MIKNEKEYKSAVARLQEGESRLKEQAAELRAQELTKAEIKRALDPTRSFHEQLREEIESYEELKRGNFEEVHNFEGLGRLLVALRIASGLSQRELAARLEVHESQVSRDERNEYRGITVERVNAIVEVLGVTVSSRVEEFTVLAD